MIVSKFLTRTLCAMSVVLLSGCGSLYLYDEGRDKLGQEIAESFEKAEIGALLEKASTDLDAHLEAQQKAANRANAAARDLDLVTLIASSQDLTRLKGDPEETTVSAGDRLAERAKSRLDQIVGVSAADSIVARNDLEDMRAIKVQSSVDVAKLSQLVRKGRAYYKSDGVGGTATNTCEEPVDKPMLEDPPARDSDTAKGAYEDLRFECKLLAANLKEENESDVLVTLVTASNDGGSGDYASVAKRHDELVKAKADLAKLSKKLGQEIAVLKDAYEKAFKVDQTAADYQEKLQDAGEAVVEFLEDLQKAEGKVGMFSDVAQDAGIDTSTIDDITGIPSRYIGQLMSADVLGVNMDCLVDAAVDPGKAPTEEACKASHAYLLTSIKAVDVFARLDAALTAPETVPSPNALLIGLAYQRFLIENAKVSAAKIDGEITAAKAQRQALLEEVYFLWSAHRNASAMHLDSVGCGKEATGFAHYIDQCKKNVHAVNVAGEALRHYDRAWTRGLIAATNASLAATGLQQRFAIEQSRQSAKVWFEILAPAVAELHAYGAGGIKAETIANLINALGLSAIAVGVN